MSVANQMTALGDGTRRSVFDLVAKRPRSVGELAELLPVSRPAVSQHLRVLETAGLVTATAHGTRRIYRVDPTGLAGLRDWIDQQWDRVLDEFVDATRKEAELQTKTQIEPVIKRRTLEIDPEAAFDLFTQRIQTWWPLASHSIHGKDVIEIRFERRVGGQVVEVTADGTEVSWADVMAWDPPNRFVLSWHPNPNPIAASTLEVRFAAAGGGKTEMYLEHRGWEEFGADGPDLREDYQTGWDVVLEPYETAANGS